MRVMKFGGTSVAGAERLRRVADLTAAALRETRVCVVASAMAGITNLLIDGARAAAEEGDGTAVPPAAAAFREAHLRVAEELAAELGPERHRLLVERLEEQARELLRLLQGVQMLKECSPGVLAHVSTAGERALCLILESLLEARGLVPLALDPRQHILTEGPDPLSSAPRMTEIRERFSAVRTGDQPLLLLPGFFGGDARGKTTCLGRGGSDLSAALAAWALDADLLEIWTDVAGIFSADPRVVPEALPLPELSFEEAMELSHFGAKVLHPKSIAPARERGIPVRVCNTFDPAHPGTLVKARAAPPPHLVRGISFLKGVCLINVAGSGMKGVPGVAARVFSAMAGRDISVVLITQGSSEVSISFCVQEADGDRAVEALRETFAGEIAAGMLDPVERQRDLCILSIVGDGMRTYMGAAGTFFQSLAHVGCNVVAIAQGSSERNISAVIAAGEGERAMRHVHRCFFDGREVLEIYLLGVGTVGRRLLAQIQKQRERLLHQGVELRVCAVANSRRMLVDPRGLDLIDRGTAWEQDLAANGTATDLATLCELVRERRPIYPVLVDCTSSETLAAAYPRLFEAGFHLVTANKRGNSAAMGFYRELRRTANRWQRRFFYETNVGAGLPVIDTLKNLVKTGDEVIRFDGILSGSMSFILGLLEEGVPLSRAVRTALERGFTEPDPRDDLSGMDVARKVLILAREMGRSLEIEDVRVEPLLPPGFAAGETVEGLFGLLPRLDAGLAARVAGLRQEGKVLRFLGSIGEEGCRVGLEAVPLDHPLAAIRGGENALAFLTQHYKPTPLVVRGYGAGADVTAAGVLADVLRLVYWNVE